MDRKLLAALAPQIRGALARNGVMPGVRAEEYFEVNNPSLTVCCLESFEPEKLKNPDISADIIAVKGVGVFGIGVDNFDAAAKLEAAHSGKAPAPYVCAGNCGRLDGKVAVVTGGAQGFGFGIAESLAVQGAEVVIADMNYDGALAAAAKLAGKGHGAVAVNISDEESVEKMVEDIAVQYGGIDLFVANAGVLRAGSVKTLSKKDWDFVTNINYSGYFLCVKHVAPVMAAQNVLSGTWSDIVQVNSKSGLAGSNRNGAYAGSKFGTIGLTQSFALELVGDKIKVNSVCPGNFLDGPLWTDPEKGLFLQYLNSGKVPGAKSIEDVKKHYEKQVPMGRGCFPADVARAIMYCVEQSYETGQAIPVTGGQIMLN